MRGVLRLRTGDLRVAREGREAHHCAKRVAHVEELRLARVRAHVLECGAQVEPSDVVVAVAPEGAVPVGIVRRVRATVRVAAHVAEPHVEARVRQQELHAHRVHR